MDWSETVAPLALFDVIWPADVDNAVQATFNKMHELLRSLVLHYLRGDLKRTGTAAALEAQKWALHYGSIAEQVYLQPVPMDMQ